MDCSPSGSSVHGIFQARTLEWVAISYSRGSSPPSDLTWISCVSCIGRWILYHWAIDWILVGLLVFCFYKKCYNRQLHCIFRAQVWMNLGVSQVKNVNGKESACQCRRLKICRLGHLVGKIPWSWKWQPTPVFLPGKFHGQRSLVAIVHGVTKSRTWLSMHAHTHTHTHTHTWMCLLVNFQIQKWDQRGDSHQNSTKGLFAHSCPSSLVQLDLLSLWTFYFRDAKLEWLANVSMLLESISGIEYLRSKQY